jgi:hypothetical protein
MTSRAWDWAAKGLRIALLMALVVHFGLTGVYVLYANPLRRALAPAVDPYIDRYFSQGWGLFAPNPFSANFSVQVRPLSPAETAAAKRVGVPKTGWYDLTRALWEHRQRMPFSYDEALGHFHVVEMQDYLNGDPAGFDSFYECQDESAEICAQVKWGAARDRERAILWIWRLGSGFVNAHFPPGVYPSMAIRIHEEFATPWRERGSGRRETHDVLMGVYATDPTVAPMPAPVVPVP